MKTFLSLGVLALAVCVTGCTTTQPLGQTVIFAPSVLTAAQAMARQAIDALNTEFAYLIDHDQSEGVADLFTESGWWKDERPSGTRMRSERRAGRGLRDTCSRTCA
jgi:hypothetical protein